MQYEGRQVASLLSRRDVVILFSTRITRLMGYGCISIVLALYLARVGLSEQQIGWLLTLTLAGDIAISLWITTSADRIGRRRMLMVSAALMLLAGIVFAITDNFMFLLIAAIVGVISPSGGEIGPFLSIEQAGLSQLVSNERRTGVFAWYNLVGSFATAVGALAAGWVVEVRQAGGIAPVDAYRTIMILYAGIGVALLLLFTQLSSAVESVPSEAEPGRRMLGLHRSRAIVLRLSSLFALDAFAGAFVLQSIMAYWFFVRFHVSPAVLGSIFFGANILAGLSALSAARIAARIGLINTMVYTHIPSNILLMLVPLMPTLQLAIIVLWVRFAISQMDVPTRQSYTMAVVSPDERSAASGVTTIARSVGAMLAPALTGSMLAYPALLNLPFFIAGSLKIVYDLLLYRNFRSIKPPEEQALVAKGESDHEVDHA